MEAFHAGTSIRASPQTVWNILAEPRDYKEWDTGVVRVEGKIALGGKLTLYTKASPKRAFPVTVTEFVPSKRMVWTGGMPLGLFKGVRTFTLLANPDGGTDFTLREQFSGLFLPLLGRSLPDLEKIFETFCADLKARAESVSP